MKKLLKYLWIIAAYIVAIYIVTERTYFNGIQQIAVLYGIVEFLKYINKHGDN